MTPTKSAALVSQIKAHTRQASRVLSQTELKPLAIGTYQWITVRVGHRAKLECGKISGEELEIEKVETEAKIFGDQPMSCKYGGKKS